MPPPQPPVGFGWYRVQIAFHDFDKNLRIQVYAAIGDLLVTHGYLNVSASPPSGDEGGAPSPFA